MRVFISGGSGLGKTTFTSRISELLKLPVKGEVIRSLYNSHKDLFALPFLVRQQIIFAEYLRIHQLNEKFISDRSVLDIALWTNVNDEVIKVQSYLKYIKPEDVVVVVPTPSLQHYLDHPEIFYDDPLRFDAYYYTEIYKYMSREEALENREEVLRHIWRLTVELEHRFVKLAQAGDFTLVYNKADPDNFYSWQDQAANDLNIINFKRM